MSKPGRYRSYKANCLKKIELGHVSGIKRYVDPGCPGSLIRETISSEKAELTNSRKRSFVSNLHALVAMMLFPAKSKKDDFVST